MNIKKLFTCLLLAIIAHSVAARDIHLVFIGNSITYGAWLTDRNHDAPPAEAARYVAQATGRRVDFRNCGVSGLTTLNFVPASGAFFQSVVNAADTLMENKGELLFSISLGTNDSASSGTWGAPVAKEQYYTNLRAIIEGLFEHFPKCKVVVQSPIWYSANTYNGAMYLKAGQERLQSYRPMILQLVKDYERLRPGRVFLGDTEAYNHFKDKPELFVPEQGNAGTFYLHPTKEGARILGDFWGKAIVKIWK